MSGGTIECDALVVGGGPAGMTAAAVLGEAGLAVTLIDEQADLGGQYFRSSAPAVRRAAAERRPAGDVLRSRVRAAGVAVLARTAVWGVDDDGRTLLLAGLEAPARGRAAHLVIACGATERVLPFRGWELPGVVTAGFAQHTAAEGVAVGQRALLAGSGPFLLPVAAALTQLGVQIAAVLEAGRPYRAVLRGAAALRDPTRIAELARYRASLARARVPVRSGMIVHSAVADSATGRVARVSIAALDRPGQAVGRYDVDTICIGYGFRPQTDLLALLGVALQMSPGSAERTPTADAFGRTSRSDVRVAGETSRVAGAAAAAVGGELAALGILADRGIPADWADRPDARPDVGPDSRALLRQRARHRRFADVVDAVFPAPAALSSRITAAAPDHTIVCRCESVMAGQLRAAVRAGADLDAVKGATRAGMGPCQGRECASAVAAICAAPVAAFTARMPLRPVSIASIAAMGPAGAGDSAQGDAPR